MRETGFMETLKKIYAEDRRYDMEAYVFMREALDYTIKTLGKPDKGPERHISGEELLEGIRRYALQEFGPITLKVLNTWGINNTEDFGDIVFNLVNAGELGKTEEDKREDFKNSYDFREAFEIPFLPDNPLPTDAV